MQVRTFTGEARRAQIITATVETLSEAGYGQTSFARIAKRAGLSSTRLISYHFAGKDELMAEVVSHVIGKLGRHLGERMAGLPGAAARLRAYITGLVEFNATHAGDMQALMTIFLDWRGGEGESRSYGPDEENGVLGHLEAILRDGQSRGEFRQFDTFVMAATIQRSLDGLPFLLRTKPDLDLDVYARELVTLFDLATRSGG
ncbi:TetR family transcriptional regulator [Nonomuraea sp. NPDC003214]